MYAAEPPAISAAQPAADQSDVIEVIGQRTDQSLKIDRRTYRVQQTPHSQQKDAIQLLRGLPAVTVSPDDTISLLGSSDVRIFVDGRAYQGDATQYLRTLHGGDVERIEIITNPSAQYSSEGTGGIINFVLRKKRSEGLSGNVSAEISSPPGGKANGSAKYRTGKWTYEFDAGAQADERRSSYRKRRTVEETPRVAATINTETGGGPSQTQGGFASGKASYEIDSNTSVWAKITGFDFRSRSVNRARFTGVTPDFDSFTGRQRYDSSGAWLFGELGFDRKGANEGETLSASLQFGKNRRQRETNHSSFSDAASLFTERLKGFTDATAQVDWQHPIGKGQILSVGGTWDRSTISEAYRFESNGTDLSGFTAADQFSGRDDKLAAYLTFQQPVAGWMVMPGLRVERDSRRITSRGHPDVAIGETELFPTLHVNHALTKALDLTLSYSKRIDRPGLNDLRPYAIVQDVLTVKQGNPRLKDQSTDAYEINFHYHHNKVDAGIIFYDRETSRLWSPDYTVVDGVNVFTIINSGHRRSTGAEFDAATPILPRLKLNTSVNLFYVRAPANGVDGKARQSTFRYTSDTTLEWDAPDRGKIAGDVAQLQWRHYSRTALFQIEDFARDGLTMSYTHSFSRTLSLSATMDYWAPFGHALRAPLVQELYRERDPVQFRLKLLKTFGKP